MIRGEIKKIIEKAVKELKFKVPEILVEEPKDKAHGDYATNVAMVVGKEDPMKIAKLIISKFKIQNSKFLDKVEVVVPGFINFFLSKEYLQEQVGKILKGKIYPVKSPLKRGVPLKAGQFNRVNVEFISANPTGPLTLGNGRGGFCGDVLANILKKAGYKVTREYYINDVGEQIKKLGHSVIGDSEATYKGKYVEDLKKRIKEKNPEKAGEKAAKIILEKMIKPFVKNKMSIKFDVWFSEKDLYDKSEVDKTIKLLSEKGFTYKSEGALWFKCKELGDDKDRVLIRSDGIKTYFASDIAYLKNKIGRGFDRIILFLGADHHGYVARLKAAAEALGLDKKKINIIIMQLVALFKNGQQIRMSKRTGTYITLEELINEIGLDVARFFFLIRSAGSHLNFDLGLAKEKSEKNPVYYIQYAHARICSILRKSKNYKLQTTNYKLLGHPSELALIKQLIKLPEIIEDTTKDYQIQRIPQYAVDLADAFHRFYENCRVISGNKELSQARLILVQATKIVLKNTLDLMGISAPQHM